VLNTKSDQVPKINPRSRERDWPHIPPPVKPGGARDKPASAKLSNVHTIVLALVALGLVVNLAVTAALARRAEPVQAPIDDKLTELAAQVQTLSAEIKKRETIAIRQSQDLVRLRTDLQVLELKVSTLPLPKDPGHPFYPMDNGQKAGQH
jgi:hypothetical protein